MMMQRIELNVQPGRMHDLLELAREEGVKFWPPNGTHRLYIPQFAPFHVIGFEMEFEDMAECQAYWARLSADPEYGAYMEKFWALTVGGGSNYTFNLVP